MFHGDGARLRPVWQEAPGLERVQRLLLARPCAAGCLLRATPDTLSDDRVVGGLHIKGRGGGMKGGRGGGLVGLRSHQLAGGGRSDEGARGVQAWVVVVKRLMHAYL